MNSKGNVQVLCCLWSTMTRECVSVKHEHFLSVLGGLISLFSSLRMRMDSVVCVGSTHLLMPQWVEGPGCGDMWRNLLASMFYNVTDLPWTLNQYVTWKWKRNFLKTLFLNQPRCLIFTSMCIYSISPVQFPKCVNVWAR